MTTRRAQPGSEPPGTPHGPPPPRRTAASSWQSLDTSGLVERLETARDLLRQAAALTAAQEARTVAAMTEQERRRGEEGRLGHPRRRRYR